MPLFKRVQCLKRSVSDTTDYSAPIDLEKFESFCSNKENEDLQEKVLYIVHMNHFNHELVDQETSSSWLRSLSISPKVAGNLMALEDRTLYQNLIKTKLSCCPGCKKARTSVDYL